MKSLFEMGAKSLMSNQYALYITSQNIGNAGNTSYSRREVSFLESIAGNGIGAVHSRRMYNAIVNNNLLTNNSALAKSDSYVTQLKNIEPLFDDDKYSIANYLSNSITALNAANVTPSSPTSRDNYLNELKNISARFNDMDATLKQQQKNNNNALTTDISSINQLTQRLAQLNNKISSSTGELHEELLDEQDKLLSSLSTLVNFDAHAEENGALTIQLINGTPLVSGNNAYALQTFVSSNDPSQLGIAVVINNTTTPVTDQITGGDVGGLLAYQNTTLNDTQRALDRLSLVFAQKMNDQNSLGMDLNGHLGKALFNDINDPLVAQSRVLNNPTNQGSADMALAITNAGSLSSSDYQLTFTSASEYQLVRKSDNQIMSSGAIAGFPQSIDADGFSLTITNGDFVAGDSYILSPTKSAAKNMNVAIQNGSQIALGMPVSTSMGLNNKGTGGIRVDAIIDTSNSAFSNDGQLNPPIGIEFISSTSYRLINKNDNSVIEDNITYTPPNGAVFPTPGGFDPGYRISISGDVVAGDEFSIAYNANASGDNRNGLLLADLYQQGSVDNDSLNFTQAYRMLSNTISAKLNAGELALNSNQIVQKQSVSQRDQLSGVSLQEEFLNLAKFKQAYEASAQIIEVGNSLFDIVVGLSRR